MNPDHLLEQARRLCEADGVPGRPRQADLRRAVSAAYYALFHRLIDLCCESLLGVGPVAADQRNILSRSFSHGEMKKASGSFAGGTLPAGLAGQFKNAAVPVRVRRIAQTFKFLQDERHAADYDRTREFTRTSVRSLLNQAEAAAALATDQKADSFFRFYLLALLHWDRLKR